jgi:hypothetical protein
MTICAINVAETRRPDARKESSKFSVTGVNPYRPGIRSNLVFATLQLSDRS